MQNGFGSPISMKQWTILSYLCRLVNLRTEGSTPQFQKIIVGSQTSGFQRIVREKNINNNERQFGVADEIIVA